MDTATLNISLNGTTISAWGGTYKTGETEHNVNDHVVVNNNVITFDEAFHRLYVQPDKTVGITLGEAASADNAFLIGPAGCKIEVSSKKISLVSSEAITVSLLLLFN